MTPWRTSPLELLISYFEILRRESWSAPPASVAVANKFFVFLLGPQVGIP